MRSGVCGSGRLMAPAAEISAVCASVSGPAPKSEITSPPGTDGGAWNGSPSMSATQAGTNAGP